MSDQKSINELRCLCADMVQNANSGHPGAPIGMAPMAYVLYNKFLRHNPKNAKFINRDRFVLSNGHACSLLYALLHLSGYDYTMEDLKQFRRLESKTPGHPETTAGEGVEVSTGPLGQGLSNAVGLAIAQKHLAARFNKKEGGFDLFTNRTFVFCGDGCLMEGITSEASSLAGHMGLGGLIVLYDDNQISIDGGTDLAFTEDVTKRYESYGWHVLEVTGGDDDLDGIEKAIQAAVDETSKPTLIRVKTTIGFGSAKQGTRFVHGSPLGEENLAALKTLFGLNPEEHFQVSDSTYALFNAEERGAELEKEWNEKFQAYKEKFPEEAQEISRRFLENALPADWTSLLPTIADDAAPNATRKSSQSVIQAIGAKLTELIGGSADLNPSCLTYLPETGDFQADSPQGRNIRFGVREHAMAAICNGLAAYGGFIPLCSTFLNFLGYCQGAVTLSALSHHQVLYVFTHDSIGLGEDGPTHQPVEKLFFARYTPNLYCFRPGDARETNGAYQVALSSRSTPSILALTRQNVPLIPGTSAEKVQKGAYVVGQTKDQDATPDVVVIGTGSELSIAYDGANACSDLNVRVVSFPCWSLFEQQDAAYKRSVFPAGVPVVSVEAGITTGWSKYAHASMGLDRFGFSAPYQDIYNHLNLNTDGVAKKLNHVVSFYKSHPVPELLERP